MMLSRLFRFWAYLATLLSVTFCSADERPVTGREVPRYARFDDIVNSHMDLIGAHAASLAVASEGRIVYARGYGWSDKAHNKPTQPDSLFRIASCTKPVTAAVVKNLIRGRRLTTTTPAFEYLGISAWNGHWGDKRLPLITVQHLLEHKGGWDREQTFDPMYKLNGIKKEMQFVGEMNTSNVIEYMLAQPLQSSPGETKHYSNFGYLVLGRIIERATEAKYIDAVHAMVCRPLGIEDMYISPKKITDRDSREVYYPKESGLDLEMRDSLGGLCTSAPSMCVFLDNYWINGDRRKPRDKRRYYHGGSQPNANSCMMEQRSDGIHYVVLFNSRRNSHYTEDGVALREKMNRTIEEIKGE
jgi:CubicO group peptidase (beta-lactamase class C family)